MGFFSRKEKLDEGLAKTRKGFFAGILDMMNTRAPTRPTGW